MTTQPTLDHHLRAWSADDPLKGAVAIAIRQLAEAGAALSRLIAEGPIAGELAAVRGGNATDDIQKELDIRANELMLAALRAAPVASIASEEMEAAEALAAGAPLAVAIDPLDGSSNIDTAAPIGTIFAILPVTGGGPSTDFAQQGSRLLAAGYVLYGPSTSLVLSVGAGTHIFTLHPRSGVFVLTRADVTIPQGKAEYAINASNRRHWTQPIRAFVDDCVAGSDGPLGHDCNTRWIASLVAESFRILQRGGIFLYPQDMRGKYRDGRLRLLYEAFPIAFLSEQAGGAATDGLSRILDISPAGVHQRVPLVFGSRDQVELVGRYHETPHWSRG